MMLPLVAILAWLPMPWEPITAADEADWYVPFVVEYVDQEPTEEQIEREWKRKNIRIMEKTDDR